MREATPEGPVAVAGRNCWRRAAARRVAFLVDGEAYFPALAAALERAEHSICIVGWDIHSRVQLRRDGEAGGSDSELLALLSRLVARRPRLRVYVLVWDCAMIFALEREMRPLFRLGWPAPRRVRLKLDGEHPLGASHHQKIVVVDDAVAFAGGMDLTASRWDTREHRAEDPRRIDPWGRPYAPFHDVQMAVDGAAAAALGEIARTRWERATGKRLPPVRPQGDRWPPSLRPQLTDVTVAVARTEPAYAGRPEVREVERLYRDAIMAARRTIYIENQYLTSASVGDALAARLHDVDGPEIVIVLPRQCPGWLEEATMGVLRNRLIRRLQATDRHGRLHVHYPVVGSDAAAHVTVHAKVLVVDDRLVRIGSANLSNRSMGLDTECDLVVEAERDAGVAGAITGFRNGLVAEHLGASPAAVAEAVADTGSLAEAIRRLGTDARRLDALEVGEPSALELSMPESQLLDPERPIAADALLAGMLSTDLLQEVPPARRWRLIAGVVAVIVVALASRVTPLASWLDADHLLELAGPLGNGAAGMLAAVALVAATGLLMVPMIALIIACGLVFGPWLGFAVAFTGAVASAALGYGLGRWFWRDAVRVLGGRRLNRLSTRLATRGVLAVVGVRVVPIAPFTIVNLVAGASHIRFRDFFLGSFLGMAPGTLALTVFSGEAVAMVRDPGGGTLVLAGVVIAAMVGCMALLRRASADR